MPGNGLSLAVRVRCQIDGIGLGGGGLQLLDECLFAPDGNIFRRKPVLQIHAHFALRQVPQVAHAGLDHIIGPQVFADGLCFRRRLNDHQIVGFAHEILPFQSFFAVHRCRETCFPGCRTIFFLISSIVSSPKTFPDGRPERAITSSTL